MKGSDSPSGHQVESTDGKELGYIKGTVCRLRNGLAQDMLHHQK